jgi:hypothetical protein
MGFCGGRSELANDMTVRWFKYTPIMLDKSEPIFINMLEKWGFQCIITELICLVWAGQSSKQG